MAKVSVVIPSYNQPETIKRCVESVLDQDFSDKYEIIVVDSSTADYQKVVEEVCQIDSKVRVIKLKQQTFPGTARNIGIKEANGEIIALIDSDCTADKYWLSNIVKNMEDGIIITGVIQNGTEKNAWGTSSFLVEFNHFLKPNQYKKEVHAAATCNFACKKEVFEKTGYFPDYRAFEDFLFCKRFLEKGGRIYQYQDICINHVNKTDLKKIAANQKMLGYYSASVRKLNKMPPQKVFKFPFLSFGLIVFRYLSILTRVIKNKHLFSFLLYNLIIIYLLMQYSTGFYKGAKEKK